MVLVGEVFEISVDAANVEQQDGSALLEMGRNVVVLFWAQEDA